MKILNHTFEILVVLTKKELKVRYKNHSLGYLWSLANPLAHALIFYIVFKIIMQNKVENFPIFLISALFPWQWIANSLGVAPLIYLGNASLIKKVNFSRNALPLVVIMQDGIHFLISIPVIFLMMYIYNIPFSINLFWGVPLLTLIQLLLLYSLGLILACINLFFRDMEKLVQLFLQFIFYLTPIVYAENMIPPQYLKYLLIHPFAPLISNWRNLFLHGQIQEAYLVSSISYAFIFFLISHFVYSKLSWRFAEVL